MHIKQTSIPENSLAAKSFNKIDYQDAYVCEFETNKKISVDDLVSAFFTSAPKWVENLFEFRNKIVKLFGLKTPDVKDKEEQLRNFKVEKGLSLGLFKILDKTNDEVLLGEDDKHLDFRISFILSKQSQNNKYLFTLSTTVKMNNSLGKLYFIPVKPFHKFIVPSMMKKIIQQINR